MVVAWDKNAAENKHVATEMKRALLSVFCSDRE